jgi:hypothetical protein
MYSGIVGTPKTQVKTVGLLVVRDVPFTVQR